MTAAEATSVRGTRARCAGAAVAAAVLMGAASIVATTAGADEIASGARDRDPLYKFSFSRPENWSPIPVAPGDARENVVRKWSQKDAAQKGVVPETLYVFRSAPIDAPRVQDDDPLPPPDAPAADLVEVIKGRIRRIDEHAVMLAPKNIQSRDDVPGRMWTTDTKYLLTNGKFRREFHLFAVWAKPDDKVQYGMWMSCGDEQKRRGEVLFASVAQSFQWFDAKAKEAGVQSALKDVALPEAKRKAIEQGLVKGWGVIVSPKKQYVVIYNTKGKRNDLLAQLIAERIEQIREELYETQFPPVKKIEDVSIVRICVDRAEYFAYGGPRHTAGYWNWHDEELVFYDASPASKLDEDTLSVAYHEAFHQYIYYGAGRIDPPSWFNEGHGDYYSGARSAGGKFVVKPFSWRIGIIKGALHVGPSPKNADGKYDRKKGGYTPLHDFIRFTQSQYYEPDSVDVCYAQGWSLIYFLREIVPKNPAWKAKWGSILDTYYTTLRGTIAATKPPPTPKAPGMDGGQPGRPKKTTPGGLPDPGPVPEDDEGDPPAGTPAEPAPPTPEPGGASPSPDDDKRVAPAPTYEDTRGDTDAALEAAFKGVDLKELEAAWRTSILQVSG